MRALAAGLLAVFFISSAALFGADASSRVLGGTTGPSTDFPEVVRIQTTGGVHQFTGVLISPVHVLTAASAVTDANGVVNFNTAGSVAVVGGQSYTIFSANKNPAWVGEGAANANAFQTGNPDIAILVLNGRVTNIRPAPIYRKVPLPSQTVTLAGFGVTGNGTTGEAAVTPPDQIASGSTTIEVVNTDYYNWVFNTGEADTGLGDEGTPSFIVENNVRFVAGLGGVRVTSGATHLFGTTTNHVRVDTSQVFVDSFLSAGACDLVPVAPFTAPSLVRNVPGEVISVTINVRNQSTTVAAGAFNTAIYLSTDLTLSANDTLIGNIPFAGIGAGVTLQGAATLPVPVGLAGGTYFVLALVDSNLALQQTDYQNDSTNGLPVPQIQLTGNASPTISSAATASVLTAFVDELIVFSVSATDANNDPLAYSWNFGDGTSGSGASVGHTFSAAGTYTAIVTVTDNFTGATTSSVTVTVKPLGTIEVVPSKFKLDFRKIGGDSITLALRDKVVFGTTVEGKAIKLSLGQDELDSGTIVKSKAKGAKGGKFSVSTSTGTMKYSTTKRDFRATLGRYGATNGDLFINVPVSVLLQVDTQQFGAQVPFFYKAKLNRNGQGKF